MSSQEHDDYADPQTTDSKRPTPGKLVFRLAIGFLALGIAAAIFWFALGLKEAWLQK